MSDAKNVTYTDANGNVTKFTYKEWEAFDKANKAEAQRKAFEERRAREEAVKAECAYCQDPRNAGGPGHFPSSMCRSGGRPHCTCDTCF